MSDLETVVTQIRPPQSASTEQAEKPVLVLKLLAANGQPGSKEFRIDQDKATVGRRKHNQISLHDQTVSGEHAVITRTTSGFLLEDLNSSNGTMVNGNAIIEHALNNNDVVEFGLYRLQVYLSNSAAPGHTQLALLEYLTGSMRGIKQRLEKPLTKVGGKGEVAVVARRKTGYFLSHLEGGTKPQVNGLAVGHRAVALRHGDEIELSDCRMRFELL